jgi:predicted dinucleotide-binding enzyme
VGPEANASGWAQGAKVVKAFNTIGAADFGDAQFGAIRADGFYCGDDKAAKAEVRGLVESAGFEPSDVGPLKSARYLEAMAMLWIDLAVIQKQGPTMHLDCCGVSRVSPARMASHPAWLLLM